jgi:hypothetical protein
LQKSLLACLLKSLKYVPQPASYPFSQPASQPASQSASQPA